MTNLIVNGTFSSSTGGTDADPTGWTVTESSPGNVFVVAAGRVAFNRGGTATGSTIEQTVTGVTIGKQVTFSFDYIENGSPAAGDNASLRAEVVDGNGNVVQTINATTNGTSPSVTFTATTSTYTIRFIDTSTGTLAMLDPHLDNVVFDVACYVSGTMIDTPGGTRAIETLKIGELVETVDRGPMSIRWIGKTLVDRAQLENEPRLRPVRIPAGALGGAVPAQDLLVSRQHRMVIGSRVAERMFGVPEVLAAAAKLIGMNGIELAEPREPVTYLHLMFDEHALIRANGALSESFLPGPMGLRAVQAEHRSDLYQLFGTIDGDLSEGVTGAARPVIAGPRLKRLLARHRANGIPLCATQTRKLREAVA